VGAEADAPTVVRGPLRAWVAPGASLARAVGRDGDPDRLLTRRDCHLVKLQRKVVVGRLGDLWVKRYNVFAWRVAVASLGRPSPARRAWRAARALARLGFATPEVVASVEFRRAGLLTRSFLLTRTVEGAVPADVRWQAILAEPDARRRRRGRRALAAALGDLFRRLHAAGVYHADLKDANILVGGPLESPACVLLDLERVHLGRTVSRRRRVKNLVQLARTLGRAATAADRLRFLAAYAGADRAARRAWAERIRAAAARKDARRVRPAPAGPPPRLSCFVICQDEERNLSRCLESVAWCEELVVVDGGSRDRTPEIARRYTDRVLSNPWPGHAAQKQFALTATRGDWVLNVDADEFVTVDLASEIRVALAAVPDGVDGFTIDRLVAYLGRWWFRGALRPRPVLRLLRRGRAFWGGKDPHERAIVAGSVRRLRKPLVHYTYASMADHVRSVDRLTTAAAGVVRPGARVGWWRLVVAPWWRFVRSHLLWGGARDGVPGLFVSATAAFYVWLRSAKVWEARRTADAGPALDRAAGGS